MTFAFSSEMPSISAVSRPLVSQLQDGSEFFGQLVEDHSDLSVPLSFFDFLGGRGCAFCCFERVLIEREDACVGFFAAVEGKVSTDSHAVGFDGVGFGQFLPLGPGAYQGILHHVFGFSGVERDTEGEPEQFVFQGQQVVSEIYLFHCSL